MVIGGSNGHEAEGSRRVLIYRRTQELIKIVMAKLYAAMDDPCSVAERNFPFAETAIPLAMKIRFRVAGCLLVLCSGLTELGAEEAHQLLARKDAVVGLWLMGQSLCDGSESLPLVTPADSGWENFAFRRGVRTWFYGNHSSEPAARPTSGFDFVPLTAAQRGDLGETIANGLADHMQAAARGFDLGRERMQSPHFLVAMAGQGGRTIEELSVADESTDPRTPAVKKQGGGYYRTSLDDARRAQAQAKFRGLDFAIGALVWMQGEANGGPRGGIVPSRWLEEIPRPAGQQWYRDRLLAYRKKWSDDLRAVTGQASEIPMFTYQTLGPAGEAQLMAADADPLVILVGPHYMVPSALNSRKSNGQRGHGIHLAADGERWFGEQIGKVMRRVLVNGEKWQPLRPQRAWLEDDRASALVDFIVPRPPLRLDDQFLARQQRVATTGFTSLFGFVVREASGAIVPIANVEVESEKRVRIRLVTPLRVGEGSTLSYGQSDTGEIGAITNMRTGPVVDGQPTTDLLVAGAKRERIASLQAEGTFSIANTGQGDAYAQVPVHGVLSEAGVMILRFKNHELRNAVPFVAGQTLVALRAYSYGNLRDSDPEPSVYQFSDKSYGTRAGMPYPLWNWCVLFQGLAIAD